MTAQLAAWLVFGVIGMAAFVYGKRQSRPKVLLISILLMVYPYFVSNALALWLVGAGLTAALFLLRD